MSTSSTSMRSLPVTFEKVSKHFGSVIAVDEVDLHVQEGEFMVLLGPSGCGKTTSLRMIAGLETATAGTIKIGDTVINKVPPRARNVAMVFQSYALYPHMKVADNIGYPLKIRKTSKARIGERVKEVAELLRIPELMERKPRELSGGQRQRVALARAIIREPNVFLFDEPLSNLDAELRLEMRGELKYLQRQLGTTAIYVTHDQAEALAMADRITVMREAKVLQVGSPMDIYDRPANAFVGHFVGSPGMSLVSGTLTSTDGWVRVIGNGFSWDVSGDAAIAVLRRLASTGRRLRGRVPKRWNCRSQSKRATRRPRSSRSSRWAAKSWLTCCWTRTRGSRRGRKPRLPVNPARPSGYVRSQIESDCSTAKARRPSNSRAGAAPAAYDHRASAVTKLRTGLVGCGSMGGGVHAPGLASHPQIELTAIADVTPPNLERVGDAQGIPAERRFADAEDMASLPDSTSSWWPPRRGCAKNLCWPL